MTSSCSRQELLDLAGIDVEAAGDDEIAAPALQRVVSVGGSFADVAGSEVAIDERRSRRFFTPPVAREDVGSADILPVSSEDFAVDRESARKRRASGKPTDPGRRSPTYGLLMFISVSVMPYRSRIVWPNRERKSSSTCAGSGAEPETNSRMNPPISRAVCFG